MNTSPPSSPGTPTTPTHSPLLSDDELLRSAPPSPEGPRATLAREEPIAGWESGPEPVAASPRLPLTDPANKRLKGKERAREGPLRLLDLPVDVLKEIIHQVSV